MNGNFKMGRLSTGTNYGNTYNFSFNIMVRWIYNGIQRTNGSLSFDIRLYQLFE